jgi:hypothetical protein
MPAEEQIKELAHTIWEKEGKPEGKALDHYLRAKEILENQEKAQSIELALQPTTAQLESQRPKIELSPTPIKPQKSAHRKKRRFLKDR